mmetsp:Transcript_16826/g.36944  ORF Transcript_16826/g.36944 Transcript_16826/m.36944 type:complete len:155 (-) Transcript_16826:219-683(-)
MTVTRMRSLSPAVRAWSDGPVAFEKETSGVGFETCSGLGSGSRSCCACGGFGCGGDDLDCGGDGGLGYGGDSGCGGGCGYDPSAGPGQCRGRRPCLYRRVVGPDRPQCDGYGSSQRRRGSDNAEHGSRQGGHSSTDSGAYFSEPRHTSHPTHFQ